MASKTLLSAVELGLFTELAAAPLDAGAIGRRLGLHPRGLRDFLDALVALGMLARNGGLYSNTPETSLFLDRAKPAYIGGVLEMFNARLYRFYGSLTEALKTGLPQNESKHGGENIFGQLYADPARLRQFLGAMTGLSIGAGRAIAAQFPWKDYRTFADIGCAQGGCPVQIALAHPHLTGVGFDLPQVQPIFEDYVASFGLSGRLRFQPGSFFDDPLPSVDVLVMGHVLHDWNLETKRMLLAKAHQALPPNGALIVYETIIDDDRRENVAGLLMSISMLIETDGGFDFTGADCRQWMKDAGFRETRVERLAGPHSMVIAIK
jgi:O-methyltransferase domain/Dimerisation domain